MAMMIVLGLVQAHAMLPQLGASSAEPQLYQCHASELSCMRLSHDGTYLFTAGEDGSLCMFEVSARDVDRSRATPRLRVIVSSARMARCFFFFSLLQSRLSRPTNNEECLPGSTAQRVAVTRARGCRDCDIDLRLATCDLDRFTTSTRAASCARATATARPSSRRRSSSPSPISRRSRRRCSSCATR